MAEHEHRNAKKAAVVRKPIQAAFRKLMWTARFQCSNTRSRITDYGPSAAGLNRRDSCSLKTKQ